MKDQLDFGNIIQQNDLIKYAEQQWGQEIEVEKIKLVFSDKAYASYFNYSFGIILNYITSDELKSCSLHCTYSEFLAPYF